MSSLRWNAASFQISTWPQSLGIGGVSTELLRDCLHRGIAVIVADAAGRYHGTMHAQNRLAFDRLAAHRRCHAGLSASALVAAAGAIVVAKFDGYLLSKIVIFTFYLLYLLEQNFFFGIVGLRNKFSKKGRN